jgi:hypothetical protein
MEPIQILEAIKEDIRDKFDGDPLMMRTMNLVITEYKARSERLHKISVGGPAQRSYSEEDMSESFIACWEANVPEGIECKLSFNEWIKLPKKETIK